MYLRKSSKYIYENLFYIYKCLLFDYHPYFQLLYFQL